MLPSTELELSSSGFVIRNPDRKWLLEGDPAVVRKWMAALQALVLERRTAEAAAALDDGDGGGGDPGPLAFEEGEGGGGGGGGGDGEPGSAVLHDGGDGSAPRTRFKRGVMRVMAKGAKGLSKGVAKGMQRSGMARPASKKLGTTHDAAIPDLDALDGETTLVVRVAAGSV